MLCLRFFPICACLVGTYNRLGSLLVAKLTNSLVRKNRNYIWDNSYFRLLFNFCSTVATKLTASINLKPAFATDLIEYVL